MQQADHQEEVTMMMMMKRKRSKRPRLALTTSSSSTVDDLITSDVVSGTSSDDEEQDLAKCLIMLAKGGRHDQIMMIKSISDHQKVAACTDDSNGSTVEIINSSCYQCKTCSKSFSSFQALGGHRASHKIKPKQLQDNFQPNIIIINDDDDTTRSTINLSLQISNRSVSASVLVHQNNKKSSSSISNRVHECGICRAEFASGQALGGHMRRHRMTTRVIKTPPENHYESSSKEVMKKRSRDININNNMLSLDLNLPAAPEHDHIDPILMDQSKFNIPFASTKDMYNKSLSSQPSSLIHCSIANIS